MTDKEFAILVKAMKAVYTNVVFLPDKEAIDVWYALLKDIPYKYASLAVQKHISTSTFPPTVADIRRLSSEFVSPELYQLSEGEAWELTLKAISRSIYNSQEEFDKLPEACQKAIGGASVLREYAMMNKETVNSVIQSHFVKSYRTIVSRMKEDKQLPYKMKEALDLAEKDETKTTMISENKKG